MKYRFYNTPIITPLLRAFSRLMLRAMGWRVVGEIPAHAKRSVAIVAPHTSNWDGAILLMAAFVLRVKAHWMLKHTFFRFPLGGVMTWLGAIPVNRTIRGNMVAKATEMLVTSEEFIIGISPEGTRKPTAKWHTGFWHIAHSAKVPILIAFIDYRTKRCGINGEFTRSLDVEGDMRRIKRFYAKNFRAKNPQNFRI